MVSSLNDQYTRFLPPKENEEEANSINASLKGIGVQIGLRDGKLQVVAPLEDTPAEKAGLLAGDEILEIDGVSTKDLSVDKAADKIRGPEGSRVTLLIKRNNSEPKHYVIKRANIVVKSVSQKTPFDTEIPHEFCYIRLSSFISRNAADEFGSIINSTPNAKGYIIDLRSNPGGLLSNAIYISDMFLDGAIIVSTVDKDGYKDTQIASSNVYTQQPVVILIDKGSASASEIFAGAMKDNNRAILIGDQSFGKGLVQEIVKTPYNTSVHVTTQKYLTPDGIDINKKGIDPHIFVELTEDDIENKNDAQLKKAVDILTKLSKQDIYTVLQNNQGSGQNVKEADVFTIKSN